MHSGGMVEFEVTICDFKRLWLGFFTLTPVSLHRVPDALEVTNCDFKLDSFA